MVLQIFPKFIRYLHELGREYLQKTSFKAGFFPFLSLINTQAGSKIRSKTPAEVQKEYPWCIEGCIPERLKGFDGDCGNTLLQNTTFSHVCLILLMLLD